MALLGFEGFDAIPTSPNTYLASITGWSIVSGAAGFSNGAALSASGSSLNVGAGQTAILLFTPGSSHATLIAGMRFTTSLIALYDIFRFYDTSANIQCGLSINASGKLIFWRGTNATVLATGTSTLVINTTYLIECSVTFSTSGNSDGSFAVHIDTAAEISASGTVDNTTTANASATGCSVTHSTGSAVVKIDDFYLCNGTGSSPTSFVGVMRVETLWVTTNQSVAFTPLSSTNSSNVDETHDDGDTTYNSAVSSAIDLFNHGSLSTTPTTIYGVMVCASIRKDDVSAQTGRTKLVSNGTTQDGATLTILTTYKVTTDMYTTDFGNSNIAWTASNVNAAFIGYERI